MGLPLLAVQTALYARLNADPLLAGKVFDYVPDGTAYPYLRIGEATDAEDNALASRGWSTLVTIHIWSQAHGNSEALTLAKRVTDLLDLQPLSVAGLHHVATRYVSGQTLVDPEPTGNLRHVVINFTVLTEE